MGMTERQGSGRTHGASRRRSIRSHRVTAALFAALLLCVASSLLWSPTGHSERIALAASLAPTEITTASPSASATASPTATPPPATLSIVSPSSQSGPVGAIVTVSGQNFAGTTVALYGTSDPACGGAQTSLGSAPVNGGSVLTNFAWPTSLNAATAYYICAAGVASPPSYRVLSATAPALQLSPTSVEVGKDVTISGANFLGLPPNSTVTIAVTDAKGTTTLSSQAVVQDDGTFNLPWSVVGAAGGANVLAKSTPENGARSALQATAALTILAPASPTASASAVGGNVGSGKNGNHNDNNAGVVVALVVGIVLLLLVMLGVVAFLLLRKRGPSPDAGAFGNEYVPGAYPGYADRGKIPVNVPQGATSRQAAAGRFGQSGFHEQAGVFPGPTVGGVAQWDEPDAGEDSDWQPRPMTGNTRQYGLPGYDDAPTHPGSLGGPADPWASQAGGYGALPQLDPDDEWGDGATQAAEPGPSDRAQGTPRPSPSSNDPYAPRGPGDTKPDTGGIW